MRPEYERRREQFGFTAKEILWDRLSHQRFEAILQDEATTLHRVEVSTNAFGEFLFISISRPIDSGFASVTFFGLGYHEGRDRWISDEWFWYENHLRPEDSSQEQFTIEVVEAIIQERRAFVQEQAGQHTQSEQGKLFDMVADLTDDDGAMIEIEDLSDWFDNLDDE